MSKPPDRPKIYHITHVNNLPSIVRDGGVLSDRKVQDSRPANTCIGMSGIKARRLQYIRVACHPGTMVGEYVPFYFCPRSVMLYILHMANHPDLAYRGGQTPVVHLECDLYAVVDWANEHGGRWAFTKCNAGTAYVDCYNSLTDLKLIDWDAVAATYWRDQVLQERKQAEFLLYEKLPLELVERIGAINTPVRDTAQGFLAGSGYNPVVSVERNWYY